jgi:Bax protein
VAIAVILAISLMSLGVLHIYLKASGIVLTAAVERSILIRVGRAQTVRARGIALRPNDVGQMRNAFAALGYDTARMGEEKLSVPRLFVSSLPADLKSVRSAAARKKLFVQALLPQILLVNELVLASRTRLLRLKDDIEANSLSRRDREWLEELKRRYRVKSDDFAELIARVDTVPVALALAQAAIESGWGTSRFAREGNAMFGQWTWGRRGGLVPEKRDAGATHSIQAFGQIADSVFSYVRNLNTHPAYAGFRKVRAAIRRAGGTLDSITLSTTLDRYSQRGQAYVDDVRGIIRRNGLNRLADAELVARTCRLADARTAVQHAMLPRLPRC